MSKQVTLLLEELAELVQSLNNVQALYSDLVENYDVTPDHGNTERWRLVHEYRAKYWPDSGNLPLPTKGRT